MPFESKSGQLFQVSIFPQDDNPHVVKVTFVPKHEHTAGPEQFIVTVDLRENSMNWEKTRDNPETLREEFEREVSVRMSMRAEWTNRIVDLVDDVDKCGSELGWSTRRIAYRVDDSYIGRHELPALVMQKDLCKVILQPVSRTPQGASGLVDLYLLPQYDDIASLYFYNNQWYVHYLFDNDQEVKTIREATSRPLSKDVLNDVLTEMAAHA